MSINSAMLAGVSGLVANSAALAAISDNIANVNTTGYKQENTDFESVVTAAAAKGAYNAGGVLANVNQMTTQQGLLQQTTSSTDLAISGQGFFVVTDKATGLTASDARDFTRAGSFQVDDAGYLRNSAGYYLQGWPVDAQGNISTDPSDLIRLTSINVGAVGGAADPTTSVAVNANLQSSGVVSPEAMNAGSGGGGSATPYDPTTNSMAMYDPSAGTGVKPDYELQIPVSDSKGGKRTLEIDFLKSDTPNQWYAEIKAVPASDVDNGSTPPNGQIAAGIIPFTSDGKLDTSWTPGPGQTPLFSDFTNSTISFGASNSTTAGAVGAVNWSAGLGIDSQTLSLSLDTAPGGLTQFDSTSVTQSIQANGTAFGNLTNIDIDAKGFVTANFDNGISRQIAQVALATFPNPDGLKSISGNAYAVSLSSGTYNLKTPGTGGAGTLSPSTLEASTVDLSTEFAGLITTQRAYAASSKIITTADQMLQELINIKQ